MGRGDPIAVIPTGDARKTKGTEQNQIDRSPFRISMFGMGNEHEMPRHYFDVRDANELAIDDEGMELPTLESVPEEAAKSLVNTATKHAVWTKAETLAGHRTSIEVRYGNGALPQHSRLNDQDNKLWGTNHGRPGRTGLLDQHRAYGFNYYTLRDCRSCAR